MTNLPLILESLVILLLVVTIGYCLILERRMRAFRDGQERLRGLINELATATARAETAVGGLGVTTREAQAALETRINEARSLTRSLALASANAGKGPARNGSAQRSSTPARRNGQAAKVAAQQMTAP